MEPSQGVTPRITEKSDSQYLYTTISYKLITLGFIIFVIAFFLNPKYQPPLGYSGMVAFLAASTISFIGFFKTQDKVQRRKCVRATFVATIPFLFYLLLGFVILHGFLRGIGA